MYCDDEPQKAFIAKPWSPLSHKSLFTCHAIRKKYPIVSKSGPPFRNALSYTACMNERQPVVGREGLVGESAIAQRVQTKSVQRDLLVRKEDYDIRSLPLRDLLPSLSLTISTLRSMRKKRGKPWSSNTDGKLVIVPQNLSKAT